MQGVNPYVSNTSKFLQNAFDVDSDSLRTVVYPDNLHAKYDYGTSTDGLPDYAGFCGRGVSTNDGVWLLKKFTYDVNRQCTDISIGYDTWDRRTLATYG